MSDRTRIAFVVCRAQGISGAPPETYEQFLKQLRATPDRLGFISGVYAWRARNRSFGLNCRIGFAVEDRDFATFDPNLLSGKRPVEVSNAYGAVLRRSLLWGRRVLISSARFVLGAPEPDYEWFKHVRHARVDIDKFASVAECLVPSAQLRLMESIQSFKARGTSDERVLDLLDLNALFRDIEFEEIRSASRVNLSARVTETPGWISCILIGSGDGPVHRGQYGDEWKAWVVSAPPHAKSRAYENLGTGGRFSQFNDASLVVERPGYALDDEAVSRFARALEHVSAHVIQLQSLRRLVDDWWGPLLNPTSWEEKVAAAKNFMREWQHFLFNVSPLWALGTDDPQIDPQIVDTLDSALHLRGAWETENARLRDLFNLCTQVLSDGDPSIHLNNPGVN